MDVIKIEKMSSEGMKSVYKISVPAENVKNYLDAEAQLKGKNFKMPGFRPGHVPVSIIRNKFKDDIKKGALDKIISSACNDLLKTEKIEELAVRPVYELESEFDDNKELTFRLTVEVAPIFEIKPYDFEVSKAIPNVTQADIEEFRNNIMKNSPIYEESKADDVIQSLDKVTYKAVYSKSGEVDASKDINNSVIIPTECADDEKFLKSITTRKVGDTFDFAPDDQQEVVYKVSIEKIEKAIKDIKPEDYAVKTGFKDLKEWDDVIKRHIENSIKSQSYLYHKSQIIEALMKQYSFDLPQTVVDRETQVVLNQIKAEREESRKKGEKIDEKTDEELKEEYKDTIDKRVLLGYIFNKIARKENITATDDELNQSVLNEINQNPQLANQILDYYRKNPFLLTYKRAEITEHKVVDFLMSHAKSKDEPVTLKEINEKVQKLLEEDDNDESSD